MAHLTQVLPLLARLDGHTDETALPQWINKHSAPSPDEKRDQIAGRIANEVLGMWYLPPQKSAYKHNRAVLQALQYLAAVEESSRRDTFVRYFQEKAHSSVEWERKATASAVAGIVGSISEPRVLLPILLTLIKDDNRTIRVHALAALLEMSSELGDQSLVIETLCAEMTLLRSGATYRQEILRELPLHAIEYTAHCKELLGNSLNDFVWAASAVVLGKIGSAARSKAVLAELEHGLASSLFLVQRLTAETFVHLNADDELKTKLLSVVQTAPKTEERCIALRKLGALGAVSPQDRTALNFLTAATAHPDLDIRAEAILSLVFYSQMDFDAHPEIRSHIGEHLQGLQQNAIWLLQPLIKEVAANFARQVTLAGYEQAFAAMGKTDWQREALTRSLQGWSRREMSEYLIKTLRSAYLGETLPKTLSAVFGATPVGRNGHSTRSRQSPSLYRKTRSCRHSEALFQHHLWADSCRNHRGRCGLQHSQIYQEEFLREKGCRAIHAISINSADNRGKTRKEPKHCPANVHTKTRKSHSPEATRHDDCP